MTFLMWSSVWTSTSVGWSDQEQQLVKSFLSSFKLVTAAQRPAQTQLLACAVCNKLASLMEIQNDCTGPDMVNRLV